MRYEGASPYLVVIIAIFVIIYVSTYENISEKSPKYFLSEDKRALKSIIQINGWRKSFGKFATNLVISSHPPDGGNYLHSKAAMMTTKIFGD